MGSIVVCRKERPESLGLIISNVLQEFFIGRSHPEENDTAIVNACSSQNTIRGKRSLFCKNKTKYKRIIPLAEEKERSD